MSDFFTPCHASVLKMTPLMSMACLRIRCAWTVLQPHGTFLIVSWAGLNSSVQCTLSPFNISSGVLYTALNWQNFGHDDVRLWPKFADKQLPATCTYCDYRQKCEVITSIIKIIFLIALQISADYRDYLEIIAIITIITIIPIRLEGKELQTKYEAHRYLKCNQTLLSTLMHCTD